MEFRVISQLTITNSVTVCNVLTSHSLVTRACFGIYSFGVVVG